MTQQGSRGQRRLPLDPGLSCQGLEAVAPEQLVELDGLGTDSGSERACEHRLPRTTAAEHHYPIHPDQCGPRR